MFRTAALPLAFAALVLAAGAATADDVTAGFPGVDQLPAGYRPVDGFLNGRGTPWGLGDVTQLPSKPIYWVYRGKIIGFNIVLDQKDIDRHLDQAGFELMPGLPPLLTIGVTHSDGIALWANSIWFVEGEFVSADYLSHIIHE